MFNNSNEDDSISHMLDAWLPVGLSLNVCLPVCLLLIMARAGCSDEVFRVFVTNCLLNAWRFMMPSFWGFLIFLPL